MSASPSPTALASGTLIIGDLHLDPQDLHDCERLLEWISDLRCPALVVVGDLFDAWVGPAHEAAPGASAVIEGFAALARRGTRVHLLHGNRDFLLGQSFASKSGASVHASGLDAVLCDGTRLTILHGDELCTRDHAYQRLRRVTRSAFVARLAPRLPMALAGLVARRLRSASVRAVAAKPSAEKAMQESACREIARARNAALVVCGHAHEARDEALCRGPRWIVLDAFGGARDVLQLGERGTATLRGSGARLPVE